MNHKNLFNNKIAKGLVSLITIIILLSSILAASIFYQNNITANVIKKSAIENGGFFSNAQTKLVDDIKELSQLNEGWYSIRNGYVYYLEHFDSYIPLWIKVKNMEQQNVLIVVDYYGTINIKKFNDEVVDFFSDKIFSDKITGQVTGLEKVSGLATDEGEVTEDEKKGYISLVRYAADELGIDPDEAEALLRAENKDIDPNIVSSGTVGGGSSVGLLQVNQYQEDRNKQIFSDLQKKGFLQNENYKLKDPEVNVYIGLSVYKQGINYVKKNLNSDYIGYRYAYYNGGEDALVKSKDCSDMFAYECKWDDPKHEIPNTGFQQARDGEKRMIDYYLDKKIESGVETPDGLHSIITKAYFTPGSWKFTNRIDDKNNPIYESKDPFDNYVYYSDTNGNRRFDTGDTFWAMTSNGKTLNFEDYKEYLKRQTSKASATRGEVSLPKSSEEEKLLEQLKEKFSDFPEEELKNKIRELKGQTLSPLSIREFNVNGKKAWFVGTYENGKFYYDQKEAETALNQLRAEKALDTQGLKPLNKIDEKDRLLAKNPKDNSIWFFDTGKGEYIKISTPTYTTKEIIGKDKNAVDVIITFDTKTGKQKEIKILKDGDSAIVDERTLKQIREYNGDIRIVEITLQDVGEKGISIEYYKNGVKEAEDSYILKKGRDVRVTEKFKTIFLDKDNNEISVDKAKQLREKGEKITSKTVHTFRQDEERKNGEIEYLTQYSYTIEKGTEIYEATKIDQNGRVVEFIYGKDDKQIVFGPPRGSPFGLFTSCNQISGDSALESEGCTALKQFASRQFFATAERVLTEFRGLGYYATLFFDEDSLLKWRDSVDRAFATLYLGTEYWSSSICSVYIDGEDEGIAYAETPQGLAQVGAHIEATRTEPIITPTGREFIYKITFNVRNGDWADDPRAPKEMNVNVVLKGEKNAVVFNQQQKIKRGSSFGRTGRNAIVQDSAVLYTHICMTFDEIPLRWKLDNKELCNTIVESSGEATVISSPAAAAAATPSGVAGASESEINDF